MARHLEGRHGDETCCKNTESEQKGKLHGIHYQIKATSCILSLLIESKKGVLVPKYIKKDKVYSETGCEYVPCDLCLALYPTD